MTDIVDEWLKSRPDIGAERDAIPRIIPDIEKITRNPMLYLNTLGVMFKMHEILGLGLVQKLITQVNDLLPSDWSQLSKECLTALVLGVFGITGIIIAADMEKKALNKVGDFLSKL